MFVRSTRVLVVILVVRGRW